MRKTTRLISLALVIMLVFSLSMTALAASFKDVRGNEYYATAAKTLADKGILNGYENGTFGASKAITRAEMATIICRVLGQKSLSKTSTKFWDTSSSHWASGYVKYAADRGIIGGDGNGKFRPQDYVKYEEAIKMVVCAIGYDRCVMPNALDWSAPYIAIANANGITKSLQGSKGKYATRGDIAVMVYNAINAKNSKVLAVPAIIKNSINASSSTQTINVTNYNVIKDRFTYTNQENNYTFTAPRTGTYSITLDGIKASAKVRVLVTDSLGYKIIDFRGVQNMSQGIGELEKGKTYTISAMQYYDTCDYTLSIGLQKPTFNISDLARVNDSLEYTGQDNIYTFVPSRDGNHTFSLAGIKSSAKVKLTIYDNLGYKVIDFRGVQNMSQSVSDFERGKTYYVHVMQYYDTCSYSLTIN